MVPNFITERELQSLETFPNNTLNMLESHGQWKGNRHLGYVWKDDWWAHLFDDFWELNICVLLIHKVNPSGVAEDIEHHKDEALVSSLLGKMPVDLTVSSAT